jgi:iron complex transport system ATP-binding protein
MTSLQLSGVTVRSRGRSLLEGIDLSIREGEFVALIGPNGAGKTTLFRAALGLGPCEGEALLGGRPVRAIPGRERAALAAWLPQQALVAEPITVLDLVTAARYRFHETHANARAEAMRALEAARAADFADRPATELSGGEQQRVAIAALIAQDAPLLLLDEPANHLDPAQQIEMYALIGRLWQQGRGVLCITHDINMLRHVGGDAAAIRVVGLSAGRVKFEASYASGELAGKLGELFGVRMHVVNVAGTPMLMAAGAA